METGKKERELSLEELEKVSGGGKKVVQNGCTRCGKNKVYDMGLCKECYAQMNP